MAPSGKRSCWSRSCAWVLVVLAVGLGGCEALAITALGVGASAGVTHTANSVSFRTFTASTAQVKNASLLALATMGIEIVAARQRNGVEVIEARSADRTIEIALESMSPATTQMRTSAKRNALVYDAATAREITEQTVLALTEMEQRAKKPTTAQRAKASVAGPVASVARPAVLPVTTRR